MRYLKRQTINRRTANHTSVYVDYTDTNVVLAPVNTGSVILPNGTTGTVPSSPVVGMMRYNTSNNEVEVYQGASPTWRALRYKESTGITQQNLGAGDGLNLYFGPLNPGPPSVVQTGTGSSVGQYSTNAAWGGQNILVVVENVLQLNNINYTVVQNPSIAGETYIGSLSVAAGTGSSILYFNTSLNVTSASWTSNVATVTVSNTVSTQPGFAIGATITVAGIASSGQTPSAFNGVFTVTGSTATTVTYALTTNPGTYQNGGSVTASGSTPAVFPAVPLTGATVSGSNIYSGALLTGVAITDPNTGALVSISQNHAPTGSIPVNTAITIAEGSQSGSGYYLKFSTPVPYGKVVVALIGFDQ